MSIPEPFYRYLGDEMSGDFPEENDAKRGNAYLAIGQSSTTSGKYLSSKKFREHQPATKLISYQCHGNAFPCESFESLN